jgi:hypothetical protein
LVARERQPTVLGRLGARGRDVLEEEGRDEAAGSETHAPFLRRLTDTAKGEHLPVG